MSEEQLAGRIDSLENTLRQLIDREREMDAMALPDPPDGDPADERFYRLEQQIATLGQQGQGRRPTLLPRRSFHFIAKITDTGPLGTEDDYTDERYWVEEQRISNTSGANTDELAFEDKPGGKHITATDLGDTATGGHTLATDGTAYVVVSKSAGREVDAQTSKLKPVLHYYFGQTVAASSFLAKITAKDAAARYTVTEQGITSSETDTLTYGNLSGGRAVTATNLDELIASSVDLPVDGTVKVMVHVLTDAGPASRYVFSGPAIVVD